MITPHGPIDAGELADGAVTEDKIAADAVTPAKLGSGSEDVTIVTSALDLANINSLLKVHFKDKVTVSKITSQVLDAALGGGGAAPQITPYGNDGTTPLKKTGPADAVLVAPAVDSAMGTEFDSGDILTDNVFAAGEMLHLEVTVVATTSGKAFFTIHATKTA